MSDGTLHFIEPTTFAAERVLERDDLQAAIKNNIGLLGDDLLVVAEEFGDFTDAHRRIDLLCIDREARPVVVELKRTTDGGGSSSSTRTTPSGPASAGSTQRGR